MIRLINAATGTEMWVADSRLDEYLAKGHIIAPSPDVKSEKATPVEMAAAKKKATRKR